MASDDSSCCSRVADVICNRQATFVEKLREMRPVVERCHMTLLCFKSDLERRRVTSKDKENTLQDIRKCCDEALPNILANSTLNITGPERLAIRQIKEELAVLGNHIVDINIEDLSQSDLLLATMVSITGENMREFMRWVDEKTERRWWLTETIRFLQLFLKLATFISAAVSVIYREEHTAPIVTLGFTIFQGVVEILDQFFVRKLSPKQIRVSLISPIRPSVAWDLFHKTVENENPS